MATPPELNGSMKHDCTVFREAVLAIVKKKKKIGESISKESLHGVSRSVTQLAPEQHGSQVNRSEIDIASYYRTSDVLVKNFQKSRQSHTKSFKTSACSRSADSLNTQICLRHLKFSLLIGIDKQKDS